MRNGRNQLELADCSQSVEQSLVPAKAADTPGPKLFEDCMLQRTSKPLTQSSNRGGCR